MLNIFVLNEHYNTQMNISQKRFTLVTLKYHLFSTKYGCILRFYNLIAIEVSNKKFLPIPFVSNSALNGLYDLS